MTTKKERKTMKHIMILAAVAAIAVSATADMKIGVVDMMKLVRNHPNYESNRALLNSTDKDYKKKLDAIKSDGEKLQEEGKTFAEQVRNPMLTVKAKGEIEDKLM